MATQNLSTAIVERVKNNTLTVAYKNGAERGAKELAEYFTTLPFMMQLHAFMDRVFGKAASEWIGKGVGVVLATIIGTPDAFVHLTMMLLGLEREDAERIVSEAIDEFIQTAAEGVKNGMTTQKAVDVALEEKLSRKLGLLKDDLPKIAFILHDAGTGKTLHELDCEKMYRWGIGMRSDNDKDREKDVLIEHARFITFAEATEAGIDMRYSGCECRKQTKDLHLSSSKKTLRECRIAFRDGSESDKALEKRFYQAYARLMLAKKGEVKEEELTSLLHRLKQPIWSLDEMRLAIQDWNPSDKMALDQLMKSAMLAFEITVPWPVKIMTELQDGVSAYVKGESTPAVDSIKSGIGRLTTELEVATARRKRANTIAKEILRRGK
jgi:hypothetical protein